MSNITLLNISTFAQQYAVGTVAEQEAADKVASVAPIAADSVHRLRVLDIIDVIEHTDASQIQQFISYIGTEAMHIIANLLLAVLVYITGKWLLNKSLTLMDATFLKQQLDSSLRSFLRSGVTTTFYVLIIIMVIQLLGVNTTSLVAMLASAGLAIGMALSGTLQNFAGGVMILFLKPYRVGDYIRTLEIEGNVKEIMLFTTVLETYDHHTIFVPNSTISSSVISNATFTANRRVDWQVGITYGDSVDLAREVIMEILEEDSRIVTNKYMVDLQPMVGVTGLGDSSVNLVVRAWVGSRDYWVVLYDVYEKIYKRLPERGLRFPFPQLDLHVKEQPPR
ncbi:MAG: mechanosensitive ion channel family protein [Rikenellaceae bacterium]